MQKRHLKPVAAAVGTAFVASLATASFANAGNGPFTADPLESGYGLIAAADAEGSCGEGKCGEEKGGEGKCGEGATDEADADKGGEGKCGEGKCGEGKCGGAA